MLYVQFYFSSVYGLNINRERALNSRWYSTKHSGFGGICMGQFPCRDQKKEILEGSGFCRPTKMPRIWGRDYLGAVQQNIFSLVLVVFCEMNPLAN